jgi:hypothetical protein
MRIRLAVMLMLISIAALARDARAQIRVNPTGVSTNAMAATTVFLTFGGLRNQIPVEAFWCGEVMPAIAPDRGTRCNPATLYGRLPQRSDLSRIGANGALTDIMSIPASIARRAYQDAQRGQRGTFFYVRRFASTIGGPDEFVAVTCRLTGGGANVPFSLTNVIVAFSSEAGVELVRAGAAPPPISARITYNGSGRLRGRWEVVMPGEELPSEEDLLTEASLPPEERGRQRRYSQLERFNVLLAPGGQFELAGPDPSRLPSAADGTYVILLRIEATDDRAGDSDLRTAGGGEGVVHNGAVAGFPMPALRYVVGTASRSEEAMVADRTMRLLWPRANAMVHADSLTVRWTLAEDAPFSRLEFQTHDGTVLLTAVVRGARRSYNVPPVVAERASGQPVRWRVSALDATGSIVRRSAWSPFRFRPASR